MPIDRQDDRRSEASPLTPADVVLFETPLGREDDRGTITGSLADQEIEDIPVDSLPVGSVTDIPDPGTTHETLDGLDETEEAVRHFAEDVPSGPASDTALWRERIRGAVDRLTPDRSRRGWG